jgi:hypothetical protein
MRAVAEKMLRVTSSVFPGIRRHTSRPMVSDALGVSVV